MPECIAAFGYLNRIDQEIMFEYAVFAEMPSSFSDFSGKCADNILRRVNCDTNDVDVFRRIGKSHAADDIASVAVQKRIQLCYGVRIFYDDADNRDSCFHKNLPIIRRIRGY